jgi:hypothetical protein
MTEIEPHLKPIQIFFLVKYIYVLLVCWLNTVIIMILNKFVPL